MKDKKSKRIILNFTLSFCILIFTFCIIAIGKVNAAELFFETKSQEFTQGEEFLANIFLNTEEESINAIEGKIVFPDYLLEAKEIRDGNSIINFWIERPRVEQLGTIVFSGIIPGGYQETKGFVFSAVFQAKTNGNGAIEIREAKVLLNDGKGTSANLSISNFQFSISEETPAVPLIVETVKDTDPPEDFKPEIAQSPEMFNGKYFLVFATQDKGSGIDKYEVCEGSKRKCVIAESPYVLQNQELDQKIFVKAVDKSGNEREVLLLPQKPKPWYKNYVIFAILIIMGLVIRYIYYLIQKSKRNKFLASESKNQNER